MDSTANEWFRALGFFFAVVVVGSAVLTLSPRLLGAASGSQIQVVDVLKKSERDGLEVGEVAQGVLRSKEHHFDRITVSVDADAGTARAAATLDFVGELGHTKVSSLGLEEIPFVFREGEWRPVGSLAPRLLAAVTALEERRAGREVDGRKVSVKSWYLRLEREGAVATEESRTEATLPDRPVDELHTQSVQLRTCVPLSEDAGEIRVNRFCFTAGVR